MRQYQTLLQHILDHGARKPTRAVLESTGEKVHARSVFGYQCRYDLAEGFPAVTTKKLAWKAMVHELLWFLQGQTNVRRLQDAGVHIWDQWADEAGEVGPVYGKQWRRWEAPDGREIDQIELTMRGIGEVTRDPTASIGRRLVVSAWNPADLPRMRLPPCHAFFQFSVTEGKLSCQLYQRSADAFLGVPFNIASYALLTHLMAQVAGLAAGEFIHTFGDLHIYENHLDQVRELLTREPHPLPTLWLDPAVQKLDDFRLQHVRLDRYQHHAPIKGEVAV